MINEFTKLAHQLHTTNENEVVKVAGLLNRIKNLFKQITNSDYRNAVSNLRLEHGAANDAAKNLNSKLKELTSALSDGDVHKYNSSLKATKNALKQFLDTIHEIEQRSSKLWDYTLKEYYYPGFLDRYSKWYKKQYPDYDAELGEKYEGKKLQDFLAFRNVKNVYITTGEGRNASKILVDYVAQSLGSLYEPKHKKEFIEKYFSGDNLNLFLTEFSNAVLLGELIQVMPLKPKGDSKLSAGKNQLKVISAPFIVPNLNVKIQATVTLKDDRKDITSPANVSLLRTESVEFLRPSPVEEEEAPRSIEEKPQSNIKQLEQEESLIENDGILLDELVPETEVEPSIASLYVDIIKTADQVPYAVTEISDVQFADIMRKGYQIAFGEDPTAEMLAGGWAQATLESGRPVKLPNNNVGNIKATSSWVKSGSPFFVKRTGEYTPSGDKFIHEDAQWRAYKTPEQGAAGYWKLLGKNYKQALNWMAAGDPTSASVVLGLKNYYTAPIQGYSGSVSALYNEFMNKIANKLPGLEHSAKQAPGPKPIVKKWHADYSDDEKKQILSESNEMAKLTEDAGSDEEIDELINKLVATPLSNLIKKAYVKQSLPKSNILIMLSSPLATNNIDKIEFARVISSVVNKHLEIDARVCAKDGDIEVKCCGFGTGKTITAAIQAVCDIASSGLYRNTGKRIYATAIADSSSLYDEIDFTTLLKNRKMFNMRRVSNV